MAAVLSAILAAAEIARFVEGTGGDLLRDLLKLAGELTNGREPTPAELDLINKAMNAAVEQAVIELKTP